MRNFFSGIILIGFSALAYSQSMPTLKETEEFLKENIIKEGGEEQIETISCKEIRRKSLLSSFFKNALGYSELKTFYRPSDVEYVIRNFQDGHSQVIAKCISGNCIDQEGDNKPENKTNWTPFVSPIENERLLAALKHHQELCGGKKQTPF